MIYRFSTNIIRQPRNIQEIYSQRYTTKKLSLINIISLDAYKIFGNIMLFLKSEEIYHWMFNDLFRESKMKLNALFLLVSVDLFFQK